MLNAIHVILFENACKYSAVRTSRLHQHQITRSSLTIITYTKRNAVGAQNHGQLALVRILIIIKGISPLKLRLAFIPTGDKHR